MFRDLTANHWYEIWCCFTPVLNWDCGMRGNGESTLWLNSQSPQLLGLPFTCRMNNATTGLWKVTVSCRWCWISSGVIWLGACQAVLGPHQSKELEEHVVIKHYVFQSELNHHLPVRKITFPMGSYGAKTMKYTTRLVCLKEMMAIPRSLLLYCWSINDSTAHPGSGELCLVFTNFASHWISSNFERPWQGRARSREDCWGHLVLPSHIYNPPGWTFERHPKMFDSFKSFQSLFHHIWMLWEDSRLQVQVSTQSCVHMFGLIHPNS